MIPQTVSQFRVTVPNLPGELAKITHLLLKSKININGMMTESLGEVAHVRLLATPERDAYALLDHAGFDVLEVPVFQIELSNKPGRLNRLAKELAEKNINILCVYGMGTGDKARLVLAVDEPDKARPIIMEWAESETAKTKTLKH
jgi:hypothetical protein